MEQRIVDLPRLLASPPSPPGFFTTKYYSMKQSFSAALVYLHLLNLPKTAGAASFPRPGEERRKRVVVAGGGWGGVSFVQNLDVTKFEVVWISPNPLFSFTPLLPSCIGGVLPPAACTLHLRSLLSMGGDATARGFFREGAIELVDFQKKTVTCSTTQQEGVVARWEEPYDYLVIGVGSDVRTFGTKGVEEFAFYLRTAQDSQRIREKLSELLEAASRPTQTEASRRQLLTFVIVGGGPSGVEAAAELQDYLQAEGSKVYRHLKPYFSVVLVESGGSLLRSYQPKIRQGAEKVFKQNNIKVLFNTKVVEVKRDCVILRPKTAAAAGAAAAATAATGENSDENFLPCGFVLWTGGVEPAKVGRQVAASLPQQKGKDRLLVDPAFRALGAQDVFAIGDCCTISPPPLAEYAKELFEMASTKDKEGLADPHWLAWNKKNMSLIFPQILDGEAEILAFKRGSRLSKTEFTQLLEAIDKSYIPPVPTAQNAKRHGEHLALLFNAVLPGVSAPPRESRDKRGASAGNHSGYSPLPPFIEMRGIALCFLGKGHAALQFPFLTCVGGPAAVSFWRFVYLQLQFTRRAVWQCMEGWIRTALFGRALPAAV